MLSLRVAGYDHKPRFLSHPEYFGTLEVRESPVTSRRAPVLGPIRTRNFNLSQSDKLSSIGEKQLLLEKSYGA
jgi:hypothetical protein